MFLLLDTDHYGALPLASDGGDREGGPTVDRKRDQRVSTHRARPDLLRTRPLPQSRTARVSRATVGRAGRGVAEAALRLSVSFST